MKKPNNTSTKSESIRLSPAINELQRYTGSVHPKSQCSRLSKEKSFSCKKLNGNQTEPLEPTDLDHLFVMLHDVDGFRQEIVGYRLVTADAMNRNFSGLICSHENLLHPCDRLFRISKPVSDDKSLNLSPKHLEILQASQEVQSCTLTRPATSNPMNEVTLFVRMLDQDHFMGLPRSAVLGDIPALFHMPLDQQYFTWEGKSLNPHRSVQDFDMNSNPIYINLRVRGGMLGGAAAEIDKKMKDIRAMDDDNFLSMSDAELYEMILDSRRAPSYHNNSVMMYLSCSFIIPLLLNYFGHGAVFLHSGYWLVQTGICGLVFLNRNSIDYFGRIFDMLSSVYVDEKDPLRQQKRNVECMLSEAQRSGRLLDSSESERLFEYFRAVKNKNADNSGK